MRDTNNTLRSSCPQVKFKAQMAVSQEKLSERKQEDVISRLNMAFPGLGGKVRAQIPVLEPEFFEELVVSFLVCYCY